MERIFKVEGMKCEHCSARVEKALKASGYEAAVDLAKGEVKVSGESVDEKDVTDTIEDLGFTVK